MEFYKRRDFGSLISDTFQFFKEEGKNFFKNFILLNGLLMILLVVIFVIGYKEIIAQLYSSNLEGRGFLFQSFFQQNEALLMIVSVFIFIIFIASAVITLAYPVYYLKRRTEDPEKVINADDILGDIKRNAKRLLILILGLIFVVTPLSVIALIIPYILIFVIIGLFLLFLVVPALMNAINFLIFDYLNTKRGFFDSLTYAVRAQFTYPNRVEKSPFWKYWGAVVVNGMMTSMVTNVITLIPMAIVFVIMYSTQQTSGQTFDESMDSWMGILIFVFYGIGMLISILLGNVSYISSGLMYYDSRVDLHQRLDLDEIDRIGSDEA